MKRMALVLAGIGARLGKPMGWERVVRAFSPPESFENELEIAVVREGFAVILQPRVPLAWHIFFFGAYEPELRSILGAIIPPGGIAIDIGANVGWHTLLMSRLAGSAGRVFAIEANPSVYARLAKHLVLNRASNVLSMMVAAGDREGTVAFFGPSASDPRSGDGHIEVGTSLSDENSIQVRTITLDAIVEDARINRLDAIKIDVEGFEWPVLQGARKTVERYRPHIIFEYNQDYSSRGGGSAVVLEEFFKELGYQLFRIERHGATAMAPGRWPNSADIWAMPAK